MAKILRGLIPKKLLKDIELEAEKADKKRTALLRKLLRLAASDPGRTIRQADKSDRPKPIKLELKKAEFLEFKIYMTKHNLGRDDVLGPALIRGWELYSR